MSVERGVDVVVGRRVAEAQPDRRQRGVARRPSPRARATARWLPTSTTSPRPRTRRRWSRRREGSRPRCPGSRCGSCRRPSRRVAVHERVGHALEQARRRAGRAARRCARPRRPARAASTRSAVGHADGSGDVRRSRSAAPTPVRRPRSAARARRRRAPRARRRPWARRTCARRSPPDRRRRRLGDVEPRHSLHRVGVQHGTRARGRARAVRPRRAAGSCPTSLFTSITETSDRPVVDRGVQRLEVDDPRVVDRHAGDSEAVPRQPIARRQHALVLESRRDHAVAGAGIAAQRELRPSRRGCRPRCRRR